MSQAAAAVLQRYDSATAHLEPPFAVVDLAAMRANAAAMVRRAGPKPIRLASKSVRCRQLIETVAAAGRPGGPGPDRRPHLVQAHQAGDLCERFNELHLIDGDAVAASAPTYRGEGQAFL